MYVIIIIKKEQLSLKMLETEIEEDKLKLNNDKIEVFHHHLLSAQPSNTHRHSLCNTDGLGGSIHNLGFIFNRNLLVKQHIIKTCKAAYTETRCISSTHQYFAEDATKTLVNSCDLPRLDYCNCLQAGYPQTVKPLQQRLSTFSHQTTPSSTKLCGQAYLVEQNMPNIFASNCTGSP